MQAMEIEKNSLKYIKHMYMVQLIVFTINGLGKTLLIS